jgi:hypothetical protein
VGLRGAERGIVIGMVTLFAIPMGIGLSAACGFRVFVPLLVMNLASRLGYLYLGSGFEWIGSTPATVIFATATIAEVLAYYIPWLDHLLDVIATPAAIIAGMVATASVVTNVSPLLKWTLALIAGGGAAALVQGATSTLRLKSTALTGGLGNPVIATGEWIGAVITALLAIAVPLICLALILLLIFLVVRKAGRLFFGRRRQIGSGG